MDFTQSVSLPTITVRREGTENMDKIENPWCIYRMMFPLGIGKIESEDNSSAFVRYSEGQLYLPEVWDKEYLERFPTFEAMVEKYAEYQKLPSKMMMEVCLRKFPSQKTEREV